MRTSNIIATGAAFVLAIAVFGSPASAFNYQKIEWSLGGDEIAWFTAPSTEGASHGRFPASGDARLVEALGSEVI